MKKIIILLMTLCLSHAASANNALEKTLDSFHRAAAEADLETYFSLFTDNAVFLGTDAGERWTKTEFRAFVEPYFSQGRGWLYQATERNISIDKQGDMAFFDELLTNKSYGTCRGSGVLIKTRDGWKVAQYNLSIPVPNAIAKEVINRISEFEQSHNAS